LKTKKTTGGTPLCRRGNLGQEHHLTSSAASRGLAEKGRENKEGNPLCFFCIKPVKGNLGLKRPGGKMMQVRQGNRREEHRRTKHRGVGFQGELRETGGNY